MDLTMIKWITVMLIIIMIIIGESFQFHRTKRDSITNDLCHNMDNGNFTTNIRGSFIFSDRLIFISNNWLVYELPTTNLDKAFGQLLMNVTSLPIEKHWKAFNKNKRFKKIKDEIIAIYSLQHESSQYLYFDVYNKQGIVFDLRKKVLHNSGVDYKNQNYGIRDQTITSINSMYTLSTKYNGSSSTIGGIFDWEIKWGFKKDWLYEGNAKTFYFLFYGKRKSDGVRDRIALVESKNVKHVKSPDPDYDLIKMDDLGYPPPCGYLYRTYFYLFVKSKVYVFVGNRWNRRNLVALWEKLTIFDTKSFFVCKESELQKVTNPPLVTQDGLQLQSLSNTPEDMGIHIHLYVPTEDPKLTIYIVIGVFCIVILLCLIVCCVFACVQSSKPKKKHKKHKKHKKESKTSAKRTTSKQSNNVRANSSNIGASKVNSNAYGQNPSKRPSSANAGPSKVQSRPSNAQQKNSRQNSSF